MRFNPAMLCLLPLLGCNDAETFLPPVAGGPAGVITGAVTYAGPRPCTENQRIVGAAVLLSFEENLLPPPEGLGTVPVGLSVVAGEELFRGVREQLSFDPNGKRVCPGGDDMVVTAEYSMGPLPAGVYEIRGFYDFDGDFNPTFSIFNLPTAGDVGGGAIANAAEALLGAPVQFSRIEIGELRDDGTRVMPATGDLVEGIPVTLGQPLPLERPTFHIREVLDMAYGNDDPAAVVIPSDYQLAIFDQTDPVGTENSFVRLVLGAGVAQNETERGSANPFFFPTESPTIFHSRQDVNGDAVIDMTDSIPETQLVPALLPLGLLTRLEADDVLQAQRPGVILQGVTLNNDLLGTVGAGVDFAEAKPEMVLALRPAVLCIDPLDPSKDGVLVNAHPDDGRGVTLIEDSGPLEAALAAQFGRPITIETGCLPQGRYAVNLIYDTGQAWTVPNEAGICAVDEADKGGVCGTRPKLTSQSVVITIGPPEDPSYCEANPTPTACDPIQ